MTVGTLSKKRHTGMRTLVTSLTFLLTLAALTFLINACVMIVSFALSFSDRLMSPSLYSVTCSVLVCSLVLLGCCIRYFDVRRGGKKLAQRYGAQPVLATSRTASDRDLLDVVAEMAAAASTQVPATYCLRQEQSINAFVVGKTDDMALVVSQGALDMLDREEIQGVVAHEFAHIVNGDLSHSTRLLIPLAGLNALDQLGRKIIYRAYPFKTDLNSISRKRVGKSDSSGILTKVALLVVASFGYLFRVAGSIGVLGASIMQRLFSRQREFLADAIAVQFSHNNYALIAALNRVECYTVSSALHNEYSSELAHICFQVPTKGNPFWWLLCTHPSVRNRIKAIDPQSVIKTRRVHSGSAAPALHSVTNSASTQKPLDMSDRFELYASDQMSCLAILYAMFVSSESNKAEDYFSGIGFSYNANFKEKVRQIHKALGLELRVNKLKIIEYISPSLQKIETSNRRQLVSNLEKLVSLEGKDSLENFAAIQLIRRKLEAEIPVLKKTEGVQADTQVPSSKRITELGNELSLLLSLMVEASGQSGDQAMNDYARVLACYTSEKYPMRSAADIDMNTDVDQAFYALSQQPLSQRQAFVRHCIDILHVDGADEEREKTLIGLFAASLGVPELIAA